MELGFHIINAHKVNTRGVFALMPLTLFHEKEYMFILADQGTNSGQIPHWWPVGWGIFLTFFSPFYLFGLFLFCFVFSKKNMEFTEDNSSGYTPCGQLDWSSNCFVCSLSTSRFPPNFWPCHKQQVFLFLLGINANVRKAGPSSCLAQCFIRLEQTEQWIYLICLKKHAFHQQWTADENSFLY